MKKVALVFALAVLLPSLVLAWLAVRSLRDQQFVLERQQSLLDQRVTDSLAQSISDYLAQQQQEFSAQVETLAANKDPREFAAQFDRQLRQNWPLAEVGFCVTLSGEILSPSAQARTESQRFYFANKDFLGNREPVEVYRSQNFALANTLANNQEAAIQNSSIGGFGGAAAQTRNQPQVMAPPVSAVSQPAAPRPGLGMMEFESAKKSLQAEASPDKARLPQMTGASGNLSPEGSVLADRLAPGAAASAGNGPKQSSLNFKQQARIVSPQNEVYDGSGALASEKRNNLSKVIPAEAEFAQLIGNQTDGMLARFLENELKLMFWHRLSRQPDLIFGAQLNLNRVVDGLRALVQPDPALQNEICLALLDDNAKPVAISRAGFRANWKHPFAATEIGDALPHWEIAAYLINPAAVTQAAHTAVLALGLLIALLLLAIGAGSWLIVSNLNAELKLARQKTDFVSNVSHELKTPLTSIRMFSELLADGRVTDAKKQHSYLNIITAEAARLTRLINNVLDFSRMESGEKKYNFQRCDLTEIARSTAETFRPHLEAGGFKFECELPSRAIFVRGDADALAQILVNLLSNAEKYSNGGREITLQLAPKESPLAHVEIKVLDRGSGVPPGSEEKVFEKFYRAHDSLSSGIQGSGLGLTIARQIARAHGGDVVCEAREGGGSIFTLRIPLTREPE